MCEREREGINGATMKESGGHRNTMSARNEYAVVRCIAVIDSADRERLGRNKHHSAKSCPRNQGVGYMGCVRCVGCVDL